jgi:NTP pyrophosphatase (non-canonical NTP hydrolase)
MKTETPDTIRCYHCDALVNTENAKWEGPAAFCSICKTDLENPPKPVISHSELVRSLVKPGARIKEEVTADEMHLLHMLMGVCGEAGELLDAIKKAIIYRKPLDRVNVVEELGDLEFYMEGIRQGLNITREETLEANISKLSTRYAGLQYSNQAAVDRADKSLESTIINLRSNAWFTEEHANRLRGVKDICFDKLKGVKTEEGFNRMIAKTRWPIGTGTTDEILENAIREIQS